MREREREKERTVPDNTVCFCVCNGRVSQEAWNFFLKRQLEFPAFRLFFVWPIRYFFFVCLLNVLLNDKQTFWKRENRGSWKTNDKRTFSSLPPKVCTSLKMIDGKLIDTWQKTMMMFIIKFSDLFVLVFFFPKYFRFTSKMFLEYGFAKRIRLKKF